eukprot:m.262188 g.262188  ORF g.262188 m.262188 type:complete len:115 (-) comp54618_c0_seq2:142-486(-)
MRRQPTYVLDSESEGRMAEPNDGTEESRAKQIESIVHSAEKMKRQITTLKAEVRTLMQPLDQLRRTQKFLMELLSRKEAKLLTINPSGSDLIKAQLADARLRIADIKAQLNFSI